MRALDFCGGDHLFELEIGGAGKGHHLDEAHLPGMFEGQARQVDHIGLVVAAHHHRIELDRGQTQPASAA